MDTLHIYIATGRFSTLDDLRKYVDQTYDEDGDAIPTEFALSIGLRRYEPMCIEAFHSGEGPRPLRQLLRGCSYSNQWLDDLPALEAESAICIFPPNEVAHPEGSAVEYLGAFLFAPRLSSPVAPE